MYNKFLFVVCMLIGATLNVSGQSPLEFELQGQGQPEIGSEFEVIVSASEYVDLYSFQIFFLWDSTVLRIKEIKDFNPALEGFNQASITLPPSDNQNPKKGKVRIAHVSTIAQSLSNNTALFTMVYEVIGAECDTTMIKLGPIGTNQNDIIEVTDINFENIDALSNDPTVQVLGAGCLSTVSNLTADKDYWVYPNPVKEYLTLRLDKESSFPLTFTLFNAKAQVVMSTPIVNLETFINLKSLSAGSYVYQLNNAKGLLSEGQVIKI